MGKPRSAKRSIGVDAYDAGTLWRMTRNGWTARCALWSLPDRWELRVIVDADLLFSESSPHMHDLFTLAEEWKDRMARDGWKRVVPPTRLRAPVA
jgi:hypothetical protein